MQTQRHNKGKPSGQEIGWLVEADKSMVKCVTDIVKLNTKDGKLYVSAIRLLGLHRPGSGNGR